jgi:hypothetical protein
MKRIFYLSMIFVFFMGVAAPAAASEPQPSQPNGDLLHVYLPLVVRTGTTYDVTGQIKDAQDNPVAGVTVKDSAGHSAVTDANGQYQMKAAAGSQELSASKTGFNFLPSSVQVTINQNLSGQDFTAVAACANVIPNPSFETVPFYWNPISGNANGYTPYYTSENAATGLYSGFTGIRDYQPNLVSWSRWRTHEISIPTGVLSATLTLAMWPKSTESILFKAGTTKDVNLAEESLELPPTGFDTESSNVPPIAGDGQYAAVIDRYTNEVLQWLFWVRKNDQAWITNTPISLAAWAGKTIKLEIGTYNDGYGGVSSAFFDDINVSICTGTIGVLTCSNVLLNSNMEGAGGWLALPAVIPSDYSTSFYYSPVRSVKNGVDPLSVYPLPYGTWQTSEFYQPVTIPATAYTARLRALLLPRSNQYYYDARPETLQADTSEAYDPKALAASEAQYGFVMDSTGLVSQKMLFKWYAYNSAYWLYREFDLASYRGTTISVLFGAANDGWGGNTALYVDDVTLEVCTP